MLWALRGGILDERGGDQVVEMLRGGRLWRESWWVIVRDEHHDLARCVTVRNGV